MHTIDTSAPITVDWTIARAAVIRRLRRWAVAYGRLQDLDDLVQDACTFLVERLATYESLDVLTLASEIGRAVSRVKRGQSPTWEPRHTKRWEAVDYAGSAHYVAKYGRYVTTDSAE